MLDNISIVGMFNYQFIITITPDMCNLITASQSLELLFEGRCSRIVVDHVCLVLCKHQRHRQQHIIIAALQSVVDSGHFVLFYRIPTLIGSGAWGGLCEAPGGCLGYLILFGIDH